MPSTWAGLRPSFMTSRPNSVAVTGSTIATIEAAVGRLWRSPVM